MRASGGSSGLGLVDLDIALHRMKQSLTGIAGRGRLLRYFSPDLPELPSRGLDREGQSRGQCGDPLQLRDSLSRIGRRARPQMLGNLPEGSLDLADALIHVGVTSK